MATYSYRINLKPIQWQRAHPAYARRHMFDPQRNEKMIYGITLESQCHHKPLEGLLRMDACFYFQVPPSRLKKAIKEQWLWMGMVPDLSNLCKFLEDAAVSCRVLADDRYICDFRCQKKWTFDEPYTIVTFTELTHDMRD